MGKIEQAMRSEISRLARKEVKPVFAPLKKDVVDLKRTVSRLTKSVEALRKTIDNLRRHTVTKAETAIRNVPLEKAKKARLGPHSIKKLRKRLGINQSELARLVGVSPSAVQTWEQGRSNPREEVRAKVIALRGMGRRDIRPLLSKD